MPTFDIVAFLFPSIIIIIIIHIALGHANLKSVQINGEKVEMAIINSEQPTQNVIVKRTHTHTERNNRRVNESEQLNNGENRIEFTLSTIEK